MLKKLKDPVNTLTHFIGLLMCIPAMIVLIFIASKNASIWHVVSFIIFGAALFLLYGASTIYHALPAQNKKKEIFHKIDHMMIFILIAGTYTPVCLVTLKGLWGWILLSIIWLMAIAGIILKAFWMNAPRFLSTGIYVIMGWMVLFVFYPLVKTLPLQAIIMLIAGGIAYTLGAVIYAVKWPKLNFKFFGFHELFHLLVMGGTSFHITFMFKYVL